MPDWPATDLISADPALLVSGASAEVKLDEVGSVFIATIGFPLVASWLAP